MCKRGIENVTYPCRNVNVKESKGVNETHDSEVKYMTECERLTGRTDDDVQSRVPLRELFVVEEIFIGVIATQLLPRLSVKLSLRWIG